MTTEKGTISVNTTNILPIIKKFLYSDHEIFLRELVSNGVDACQKISKLAQLGEYNGELGELKVSVTFDKNNKTITVSDNGLGMTADEVKKYINQIAFSGAAEFAEKYKDKGVAREQIIGNFGLGFYSAFMVAKQVELITKSYQDAPAVRWTSDGSTEFELTSAEKSERGTDIILHVETESEEFLDEWKLKNILRKYCKFLPIPIFFKEERINETAPLWTKQPSELNDEDYLNFYKELYPFSPEPLFWIHLNVDYPFNLTGILYFPKVSNNNFEQRDKIHLYCRQVFVTDEVKEIVPEFLTLLHGVIDSPDIPLNVSRSYLQADGNVKKINSHITKKVADKLQELFRNDRAAYEQKWSSIGLFVKFGFLSEDKFAERAKEFILLQNTEDKYFTLDEYRNHVVAAQTDKNNNVVYLYANQPDKQDAYIKSAKQRNYDVLKMTELLDAHFINKLEGKLEKTNFKRVDADAVHALIEKGEPELNVLTQAEQEQVKSIFESVIKEKGSSYAVKVAGMHSEDLPVTLVQAEFMRRMQEMSRLQGNTMFGDFPEAYTLVVNANHAVINKLLKTIDDSKKTEIAKQLLDLALLSQGKLTGKDLTNFIQRSAALI